MVLRPVTLPDDFLRIQFAVQLGNPALDAFNHSFALSLTQMASLVAFIVAKHGDQLPSVL